MQAVRIALAATVAGASLLAGCGGAYDPPLAGAHDTVRYQTDIRRCRKQADATATRRQNATPQSAVAAIFESGEAERQDVVTCMKGRGYVLK